jgi:nitroimidazol reductase NimA-like FMN-containing flavoprotein (pyridoxamine 5'-phosphate oxidase superfamily)
MAANATLTVPPHVLTYLTEQTTLTLATASMSGVPHAATLTYVNDGVILYVWTRPDATTAGHIEQNPLVSFAIDQYAADWRQTQGIQGAGEARVLLNPEEIRRVVGLFERKFPSVSAAGEGNISFFRLTPTELTFIEGASGAEGSDQALGFDYHKDLVYSVFRDLPPTDLTATIGASLQVVHADPGTVIVRQGAPADKFFIVVDGEVEVIREDGGERRTVAHLGRGQFFGEMAILRDMPWTATVQAAAATTLFAMERDAFRSLVAQSLGTTQDFDRTIQQRLSEIAAGGRA